MSLREIQKQMRNLVQGKTLDLDYLNNPQRMSAYIDGYPTRLFEALCENYEATYKFCGYDTFLSMSLKFIKQYPSTFYTLNDYHESFLDFVSTSQEGLVQPILGDLARYDWLFMKAFHAHHSPNTPKDKLISMPQDQFETLTFTFQSHLNILMSKWPVHLIWDHCISDSSSSIEIPLREDTQIILFRRGDDVYRKTIDLPQFHAISLFKENRTLGEVCATLAETYDAVPISEWMQLWMSEQWICDVAIK